MVYYTQNYWVFTFSIGRYPRKQKTWCFRNWICFCPQVLGKTPTQLGPLERANVNQVQWLRLVLSKGSKWVQSQASYLLHAGFLFVLFFDSEDASDMCPWNFGSFSMHYKASYPRWQNSSDYTDHLETSLPKYISNTF
jgi:hypothetical protein